MKAYDPLKDEFVQCRTLGHGWESIPYDGEGHTFYKNSRSVVNLLFRCVICGGKRYEAWSKITGDLVDNRKYVMPDGYALAKEAQGTRKNMRRESLVRGLMYLAEDPPAAASRPKLRQVS
jgi:hypothetical protein